MGVTRTRTALAAVLLAVAVSASAADCVTDYRLVSERGILPNRPAGPSAWNGSVLAVARIVPGNPVVFSRYDANLNHIGDSVVTSSAAGTGPAILLAGGGDFGLLFTASSGAITFQQINAAGIRTGGEVQIGASHGTFPNQEYDAAYNAFRDRWEIVYTVTNTADFGLWVTSIPAHAQQGNALIDQRVQFFLSEQATPRIAVTANGTVAISWFRPVNNVSTLFVGFYDPSWLPFASILVTTTAESESPRLATNGTSFALVYQSPISGGTELRWLRFDAAGRVTNADARLLVGSGIDIVPVHFLWSGSLSEWALSYIDATFGLNTFPGDYRLRRINASGALISDVLFTPDLTKSLISGQHNVTWNGAAYVGSIERFFSREEGSDSYLVKHCPLLGSIKVDSPAAPVIFQPFTFTASANGGLPPYKFSWDFGDRSELRTETSFTHAYQHTGTYTVTLTVTDSFGDKAVQSRTVVVVDSVRRRPTKR